jgi:hypothetical protein
MIAFSSIQSTLKTLLTNHEPFEDLTVVEHLGTQQNEQDIEEALRETGVAFSILVPVRAKLADQKGPLTTLLAHIPVFIDVNVERNDTGNNPQAADIDIYTLVSETVKAICGAARATVEHDRFGLAEDALELNVLDAGLFRYQLMFTKQCVL